jgi:hypothetical protein
MIAFGKAYWRIREDLLKRCVIDTINQEKTSESRSMMQEASAFYAFKQGDKPADVYICIYLARERDLIYNLLVMIYLRICEVKAWTIVAPAWYS